MSEYLLFSIMLISIGSAVFLVFYLTDYISAIIKRIDYEIKAHDSEACLLRLDEIIRISVIATNQKVVNSLKKTKSFYQLDKEEAFNDTKWRVLNIVKGSQLSPYIKDLDEWINSRIEYYVKREKLI